MISIGCAHISGLCGDLGGWRNNSGLRSQLLGWDGGVFAGFLIPLFVDVIICFHFVEPGYR